MKLDLPKFLGKKRSNGPFGIVGLLRGTEAAELLEFALALPMILVMLVGILDFANAYHLKQELANAAREGARLGSSETRADIGDPGVPATVQSIKDDVTTYLQDAGVNTSFIATSGTAAGNYTWTFYGSSPNCPSGTCGLKIERNYIITDSSGNAMFANRVTLTYPYNWTYGFNNVMKLLIPSSSIAGTITLEADSAMPQIAI